MNVTLYSFSKRVNSTKQPTAQTPKKDFTGVELKAPSSVLGPSLLFSTLVPGDEIIYNYCYITNWTKYYFITNWTWENGLWRADLSEDLLSTFKTQLLAQSFYVLRSASLYDGQITDTFYPTKGTVEHLSSSIQDFQWYTNMNSGWFVVSIINSDASAVGGVSYYAFTPAQYRSFSNYLLQNTNDWMNFANIEAAASELTGDLIKTLNNPYQYITSLQWYPMNIPQAMLTAVTTIPYGWWSLSLSGYRLNTLFYSQSAVVTVPKHPQATTRGWYLQCEPYSSYTLIMPPFGVIPIPAAHLADYTGFTAQVCIDYATGKAALNLSVGTYVILHTAAQFAIPIQVSAISQKVDFQSLLVTWGAGAVAKAADAIVGGVNSVMGWVGNTFGFDAPQLPTSAGDVVSGIANGVAAQNITPSCMGNTGSLADYYINPIIELTYNELVDEDLSENGRPLCKTKQLSTLSGFCMCQQPDPQLSTANSNETAAIAAILAGGFFIE